MVISNLKHTQIKHFSYSKNLQKAFEYLKNTDLLALPLGKTIIDGDEVYLNRLQYQGKELKDCKIEGHKNYLDIQLVVQGKEKIGYVDIDNQSLSILTSYDDKKDKTNYLGELDGEIVLSDGFYALVFPEDLHMPQIKVDDNLIEKVVVKVKIDF